MLLAVRSEDAASLPPIIINNLIENYGRKQALKEALLDTKPSLELCRKFEEFDYSRMSKAVEGRVRNNRPVCSPEEDWLRHPEEDPLVDPMEW